MTLGALLLVLLVGGIVYYFGRERGAREAEYRRDAYDLWHYSGTISMDYLKAFPEMARDLERRRLHPESYTEFRLQAQGPNPIPYADWVRAHYADSPLNRR